ncbi:MAG: site-specific DNA-methyltransferase [Rhodobacteraceae bacterium]|nr:site-specific DNA-methyltransferase [Paracoccaceae bacterium]
MTDTPFAKVAHENLTRALLKKPKNANKNHGTGGAEGQGFRFYCQSSERMPQCADGSVALTVTSPPYWNAIDYDIHACHGREAWHRVREYTAFGDSFEDYLNSIARVFTEVLRATLPGGFCAIVIGTILHKGKHYPTPMLITERLCGIGWEFHQDIIWNKVTGGVRRAGVFIQKPRAGYYYPNIMTEYILIFRKPGTPRRGAQKAMDIDDLFTKDIANNVWHIAPVPPNSIDHPCPFPRELARRLILLYSDEGDEVLDPFLGSGQTALASVSHGRRCVGYDIEEKYIALARSYMKTPPPSRKFNLIARFEKVAGT